MTPPATKPTDTFDVRGGHLVEAVKDLLHEGNVRRLIIKDGDGRTVMEIPVTVGLVGFIVAPTMTAVAALAALAGDYTLEVVRDHPDTEPVAAPASEKGNEHE